MRTFVFGDLANVFKDNKYVAYCYSGSNMRGTVALYIDNHIKIISPNGYISSYEDYIYDDSNFELWAFIHEMTEDDDIKIREEAVNRFFDVYCNLYIHIPIFQEYPFITE